MKEEEKKKLEFAARNIQFETGKSVLKPASYKVLDEIAAVTTQNAKDLFGI